MNCLWIVGGGVYLLYWIFFKKKTCPICNGNHFTNEHNIINSENGEPEISKWEQSHKDSQKHNLMLRQKLEDQKADSKIKNEALRSEANAAFDESSNILAETIRKRKAGELPWQIAKVEKKLAKEQKN